MKKLYPFLLCLLNITIVFGQSVSLDEAQTVADRFMRANNRSSVEHVHTEINAQNQSLFYIFNSGNGFVVISGDRNSTPLLAYSFNNQYQRDNVIPPAQMWFDHYAQQIALIKEDNVINLSSQQLWDNWLNSPQGNAKADESVSPFVTSQWDQDDFYNFYCPKDMRGSNGRAVTGCVATAMAQILYYFRWPESGTGEYTYLHEDYGVISANFGESSYHYDEMTDKPTTINPAIGLLCFHLGVAVDMVYGANSSGMFNHKAAYAMRTFFKYSPETEYVYRDSTTVNWDSLMVTHLDRKIPLYYAGWSVPHTDGHGFVCDGYQKMEDERYYYHFNFGWSGYYDGYFYTEALSPGGSNFNLAQEVIINGYPDSDQYPPICITNGNHTITSASGSFEDCSGPTADYSEMMDYRWDVTPDVVDMEGIDFEIIYEIAVLDTLFITTDDPSITDIIITDEIGTFSREIDGSSFSVRFKTSGENSAAGFKCNYNADYEPSCKGTRIFTAHSATFDDGSGDQNYSNCVRCRTNINPTQNASVQYIILDFHRFESEAGEDILYIYDNKTGNLVLLDSLSGNLGSFLRTYETRRLALFFETSAKQTFPGWELTYYVSMSNVEENDTEEGYRLYPNPVREEVTLEIATLQKDAMLSLYNSEGKLVHSQPALEKNNTINLSGYSSGLYMLQILYNGTIEKSFKIIKKE